MVELTTFKHRPLCRHGKKISQLTEAQVSPTASLDTVSSDIHGSVRRSMTK